MVEVGSAVTHCAVGDHVILSTFQQSCGHCPDCEGGDPGNCSISMGNLTQPYLEGDQPLYNFAGIGAFVQETIVGENQCIPIPKEMPLTAAALIGCGVITGTGAVFNRARLQLGDTCVVIGAGGVGLNVIQAAKLCGASQIIAVDRVPEKERFATEFGATDFILADEGVDVIAEVKKMTGGGVKHAFEVVGSTKLLADCLQMTRPGGNICAVGVPDLTAEVTYSFQALHQNKNLMGIRAGGARPRKDFPMLANLYMKGQLKLDELISHTAGLDGLTAAFDSIRSGTEARTVLLPNG
ncbi:MAG: zinc-binding dehydrogenase [Acidimicrobiales bacterium]